MLAALLLAVAQAPAPDRAAVTPSSAVVIVLDDVASADLALYGGPVETPYLAQLAARGVLFTNAYGMATCAPARRSLLTGHWWTGESGDKCGPPAPEWPTAAEVFLPEALGIPAAIFGKWHLGGAPGVGVGCAPLAHGFQHWIAGLPSNVSQCGGKNYTDWVRASSAACGLTPSSLYAPEEIATAFRTNWAATTGPRFAVIGAPLPHGPFHVPPANLLPANYPQPIVTRRQRYEAMIRAQDTLLGQMLAGVNLEDTLVVVVADNGTPTQVAPDPAKAKTTVYERGVRVPLIFAGGPITGAGRASDALISIVDIYATTLDALGASIPSSSGGYPVASLSFLPVLKQTGTGPRVQALVGTGHGRPGAERGAIGAGRKLRTVDQDGDGVYETELLFDLQADPAETVDVSAQPVYASDLAALRAFIAAEALP